MSTAGEGSYEVGGRGGGGKFQKRPFRRPQTTPYDRPPNSVRNPRNGWLSKVVDPASRLITASANRLFNYAFGKRLPKPALLPPPEKNEEPGENLPETVITLIRKNSDEAQKQDITIGSNPINSTDGSSFGQLEQILKQKTFSRYEIDRLTALLHSRTGDFPVEDEEKRTPDTFTESHRLLEAASTPVRVLEDDVASPAQLAKAYMGSRPSKEDLTLPSNILFPPKLPIMSIVPKSPAPVGISENGFMTPRSRGRSALYSMARTPYSRVNPTTTMKLLKRKSSVLDSDIGSVGPIRRIRQKPNLLSSKSLGTAIGGSPLSATGTGAPSDMPLSLIEKPHMLGESNPKVSKKLMENGDNSRPGISFAHVPSQSSEMAEKILQQLDKLAPSPKEKSSQLKLAAAKEKSPAKLLPSMLRGQALKSLENVDSSKILESVPDNSKMSDMLTTCVPDARETTFQKPDKVENGPTKLFDGSKSVVNNVDSTASSKDAVPSVKNADYAVKNSVIHPPTQKKWSFQMSVHEDYVELDDDLYPNGLVSNPLIESREKPDKPLVDRKETVAVESVKAAERPSISSEKSLFSSILNKSSDAETSGTHVAAEKNTAFTFPVAPASSMTVQPVGLASQPSSTFDTVVPVKELNAAPPVFSFDSKDVKKTPPFTFASLPPAVGESFGLKFGAFSEPKPESSSITSVSACATEAAPKVPESSQADTNNIQKAENSSKKPETLFSSAVSASSSTAGMFSFGAPSNNANQDNGLVTSSFSMFTSPSQLLGSNTSNQSVANSFTVNAATAANTSTPTTGSTTSQSSSLSGSTYAPPSFSAPSFFTFGSSVAPLTSASPVLATSGVESTDKDTNTKKETTFGNLTNAPFGGTSPATANTGNSIFGLNGSTSNANSQSLGGTSSIISNTGSGIFGFSGTSSSIANSQTLGPITFGAGSGSLVSAPVSSSPAGTGFASTSQSMPTQFSLPATSSSFGVTGAAPVNSSNSLFGSSTPKLFGSGSSGPSSSASLPEASTSISSTSGITSSIFGSNWQTTKSPIFGSTSTPGFPFGGSGSSASVAPMVFGSSTSASSASIFSFISSAGTASSSSFPSSQPIFGNSNSVFPFGSSTGNHDQMNMEDSMAEDTVVQASSTPPLPALGQQSVISPLPSTAYMFGSAAPSGANNTFQFGSQPSPVTPQNLSPFQSSSSLDFNAAGSFSLGTGGGDKSNRRMIKVKSRRKK